jgi:hypothetical protein
MAVRRICIEAYANRFEQYPTDLLEFAKSANVALMSLESMRGQALALMAQPEVRGQLFVGREEATKFFKAIGMETKDAIQHFNKATGLVRIKKKGLYCLKYPFECDLTDIVKRAGASISGDRNAAINRVKELHRMRTIDVPNEEWQIGHLDPTIGDASEANLAYQPPIQGRYRDRFKFDADFVRMWPTAAELIGNFSAYYTDKELRNLYEALSKRFHKQEPDCPSEPNCPSGLSGDKTPVGLP